MSVHPVFAFRELRAARRFRRQLDAFGAPPVERCAPLDCGCLPGEPGCPACAPEGATGDLPWVGVPEPYAERAPRWQVIASWALCLAGVAALAWWGPRLLAEWLVGL